jgi:hypothetical protein
MAKDSLRSNAFQRDILRYCESLKHLHLLFTYLTTGPLKPYLAGNTMQATQCHVARQDIWKVVVFKPAHSQAGM